MVGCEEATIVPYRTSIAPQVHQTISYQYDGLNRLTAADYSDGKYFHYQYDATGNRLSEESLIQVGGTPVTTESTYDEANRLITEGGTTYSSPSVHQGCGMRTATCSMTGRMHTRTAVRTPLRARQGRQRRAMSTMGMVTGSARR